MRWRRLGPPLAATLLASLGPLALTAGADTSLVGYNASALAVGAQFTFNVPNVVPLPKENLIEEDVPFARTDVGSGPVVDSLGAPYYPGDIAADLGSLLATFGFPGLPLNDPLLAQSKYPTSPGYLAQASFGLPPNQASPLQVSIFSSSADTSGTGGAASATVADVALDTLGVTKALSSLLGPSAAGSLLTTGNISATNSVTIGASTITATSTSVVKSLDIAGLVDIAGLTSTATAVSDGTTGTPTATLHLGQVTVDGETAFIDSTGVHLSTTSAATAGITPAQLQQTVDATLAQDGISIRVLDPKLTSDGPQASADAGGLQIAISHQFDLPFIPGEPTIPVPGLGNVGLPAGLYTATTSMTFGLAQSSVTASGTAPDTSTTDTSGSLGPTLGSTTGSGGFGTGPVVQTLAPTGPGSAQASAPTTATTTPPPPVSSSATDFPIHGIPPPLGWTITFLLACLLLAYPLLLLARWQFVTGRRP
ncbi:MAG TPA: hypothetical protein VG298_17495 [Acidimicrobiales bacterium]|nr:hypothetical protein [Acidimicrobiales bacterium]